MSEEKPTFKITDRRLFNADGTAREIEREEAPPPPTPAQAATAPTAEATRRAPDVPAEAADAEDPQPSAADAQAEVQGAGASGQSPDEADDPQEFLMVVEFIASFAAEALGMPAHPEAGDRMPVNLPLARQCIDMLGTLERKTRGNLSAEERHYLDLILTQLRMQYVQLTRPRQPGGGPAAAPRGFSGGDITGGR